MKIRVNRKIDPMPIDTPERPFAVGSWKAFPGYGRPLPNPIRGLYPVRNVFRKLFWGALCHSRSFTDIHQMWP